MWGEEVELAWKDVFQEMGFLAADFTQSNLCRLLIAVTLFLESLVSFRLDGVSPLMTD